MRDIMQFRDDDASDARTPDQDYQELVEYLANELDPAARQRVEQRLASDPTFAALAAVVTPIWRAPLPVPPRDQAAGWAAVQRKVAAIRAADTPPQLSVHSTPVRRRSGWGWTTPRRWLAVAATLVVVLIGVQGVRHALYPAYYYKSTTVATTVTLPDGSQVQLAPGSYLGTEHGFPTRNRSVYLFGHAHFTVAPTSAVPFIVTVPGVSTHVLGTQFTIEADTIPTVRVAVTRGKVALETADSAGHWHALQVLTAGDAVQIPRIEAWLMQAGYAIGGAGVPFREAMHLGVILRRAAFQAGAAAAHTQQ